MTNRLDTVHEMTSQASTSSHTYEQYPLFTDLKFTLGCPRQTDDNDCGICFEDVTNQFTLTHANGSCKVAYCLDCWEHHFENSVKCPNCRGKLTFNLTVMSDSLTGKPQEISEQPWFMRERQRANGFEFLRIRYRDYDIPEAVPFLRIIQPVYRALRIPGYPHTIDAFLKHQGPWSRNAVFFASFFIDVVWAYEALASRLNVRRLHTYSNLIETIFEPTDDGLSEWSHVEIHLADSPFLECFRKIIRGWAEFNISVMDKSDWWWDEVMDTVEPQYLMDEAEKNIDEEEDYDDDEDALMEEAEWDIVDDDEDILMQDV